MSIALTGDIRFQETIHGLSIVGFSSSDIKLLMRLARKKYKIKTRKKRILKKYVVVLLDEALEDVHKRLLADRGL